MTVYGTRAMVGQRVVDNQCTESAQHSVGILAML